MAMRYLHHLPSTLSRNHLRFFSNQEKMPRNLTLSIDPSVHQSYMELSQMYYEAMQDNAAIGSIPITQKLHAQLIFTGLISSTFLQNHLIDSYSKCGLIDDALQAFTEIGFPNTFSWNMMISRLVGSGRTIQAGKLFDEMPDRNSVSWNSIMSGYFDNGQPEATVNAFREMIREGNSLPDMLSFSCVMKACGRLGYEKLAFQLHGLVERYDFGRDISIRSSLIDMYIKCGAINFAEWVFLGLSDPSLFCWNSMIYGYSRLYGAGRALELFNKMPQRNSVSWNTMISVLSHQGYGTDTLNMFLKMSVQGFLPNSATYARILSACTNIYDIEWGVHLHARIIRMGHHLDSYIASSLINMYAKCGRLANARRIFNNLTESNVVSWTSLIGGLAQSGHEDEALTLFKQMVKVPVAIDQFTIATVLSICSDSKNCSLGSQLHAYATKTGTWSSVPVGNAIVTMYAKCGNVQCAKQAFELMPVRDTISWTIMVTAFSQIGDVDTALEYFTKMPERNVVTWNSILSMYAQLDRWEDSLKVYILMLRGRVKPDWVTFTTVIGACADLAVLGLGSQLIAQVEKWGFTRQVSVVNSVITMYARCGRIEEARNVFDSIVIKNLISWNAMMDGYAQSGQGRKVLETFEDMLKMGFVPDNVSYVSVLSGCSHSGLVSEGQHYFSMMTKEHGISPSYEHFACMVDLFGRAGLIDKAKSLIDEMHLEPSTDIWKTLLAACRIYGSTRMAEIAVKNLNELGAGESGNYVILANAYFVSGDLEGVSNLRKFMKEKGVRKNPGCSWIEVGVGVHIFTVDHTNHPQMKDIYRFLKDIKREIEDTRSYVSQVSPLGEESTTLPALDGEIAAMG